MTACHNSIYCDIYGTFEISRKKILFYSENGKRDDLEKLNLFLRVNVKDT
jgi:hypothetical protein